MTALIPQGDAWVDLIKALTLLSTHPTDRTSPLSCEHDELYVMADPRKFSPEELDQLSEWGFDLDKDNDVFFSFRFGSA